MKLNFRKHLFKDNWYIIEPDAIHLRTVHQIMGSSLQMLAIAEAIDARDQFNLVECAVRIDLPRDDAFFWNPTDEPFSILHATLAEADELSILIKKTLGAPAKQSKEKKVRRWP